MIEVGRLCLKTAGREAGKVCVIVKNMDPGFVLVTGPKAVTNVRRRKCSVSHVQPLPHLLELKADASDNDVLAAYEKGDIYAVLKLSKPTAEKIRASEEQAKSPKPTPPQHKKAPAKKEAGGKKEEKAK